MDDATATPTGSTENVGQMLWRKRNEFRAHLGEQIRSQTTMTPNAEMVCPHCQTKGSVSTQSVQRKRGVSGGKLLAGFFTFGISWIFTGLSRKEAVTLAKCSNCSSEWTFSRG